MPKAKKGKKGADMDVAGATKERLNAMIGEVEAFELWQLERVAAAVAAPSALFKPNCNLVIIDFLVRHGWLTPEMPGYCELVAGLHSGAVPCIE